VHLLTAYCQLYLIDSCNIAVNLYTVIKITNNSGTFLWRYSHCKAIARFRRIHLINLERRQAVAEYNKTKLTNLHRESACHLQGAAK